MNIYLLKCSVFLCNEEWHKEDVYSSIERAKKVGLEYLETEFREYYDSLFDNRTPKGKELTLDELFELEGMYELSITEFDPYEADKIEKFDYEYDEYFLHEPTHKIYFYNYKGEFTGMEVLYKTIHNKHHRIKVYMDPSDFEEGAGTKFKVGDIVKINSNNYNLYDRLHVITRVPHKKKEQKYFENTYYAITNHNPIDNGCHEDCFKENEIELYNGKIEEKSPILFLSKIYKGEIKISAEKLSDLKVGNIALNDAPSFRDIKEWIMS